MVLHLLLPNPICSDSGHLLKPLVNISLVCSAISLWNIIIRLCLPLAFQGIFLIDPPPTQNSSGSPSLILYAAQGCKSHLWLGAWLDCWWNFPWRWGQEFVICPICWWYLANTSRRTPWDLQHTFRTLVPILKSIPRMAHTEMPHPRQPFLTFDIDPLCCLYISNLVLCEIMKQQIMELLNKPGKKIFGKQIPVHQV